MNTFADWLIFFGFLMGLAFIETGIYLDAIEALENNLPLTWIEKLTMNLVTVAWVVGHVR